MGKTHVSPKHIVLATDNTGKLREMHALMATTHVLLIAQSSFGISTAPETGYSFYENALLKARHASTYSALPALADDSGLIVPALQAMPGRFSARYAGENSSDKDNITKLLWQMRSLQGIQRQAWFYCILVFVRNPKDTRPIIGRGILHGNISTTCKGLQGFGYDPIFQITTNHTIATHGKDTQSHNTKTLAQLDIATKNTISHRAKALTNLLAQQEMRAFIHKST